VILVLGALNARKSGTSLAKLLASQFTAITYDRRGRGASGNSARYSPQREVEDVAALIGAGAGSVCLYGHSSGGAIAIDAAVELRKQVRRLAIYEAPYAQEAARGWAQRRRRRPVHPVRGSLR
jgi:pimeloyl-ACP methyl ester carboxylesterase